MRSSLFGAALTFTGLVSAVLQTPAASKGVRLETHSWVEARDVLQPDSVVVIPLGAALKEHGPHLKLRNDLTLAEYFANRMAAAAAVVVTPPLTYHFYPAFLEYPGSTSLTFETARDYTIQVVRSLAAHGPRRFYVLNTGISTKRPLDAAAATLAQEGILMRSTDFGAAIEPAAARIRQQERGSRADEIETSMMLYIDPSAVNMKLAVKDANEAPAGPIRFTRQPGGGGVYSQSGAWGDPTLATVDKGRLLVEGVVSTILNEIAQLRSAPLPTVTTPGRPTPPLATTALPDDGDVGPNGCMPGEERTIRAIEAAFNAAWANHDPITLGALWAVEGDIMHADGFTERGRLTIQQNRIEQFKAREYRGSKHILGFLNVRCLNRAIAVVDSNWELRGVLDTAGRPLPNAEGLSTLVAERSGNGWLIEAYRYNVKPGAVSPPRLLSKPGYPDKR